MKRFLIVQPAFLGDLILTTPLFKKLQERFAPEPVEIHVVTSQGVSAILQGLDGIQTYELRKRDLGLWSSLTDLFRKMGTDLTFDGVFCVHRSLRSLFIARWVKCRGRRLAFGSFWNGWLLKLFGFEATPYPPYSEKTHYRDKVLALYYSYFGDGPQFKAEEIQPWLKASENEVIETQKKFPELPLHSPYIVVSPSSAWGTKEWPLERFLQLAENLQRQGRTLVFIGGTAISAPSSSYIDLRGKTSLVDLKVILMKAQLLIANDSAPVHVAAAFDRPTVAVFGPTVKKWGFYPLSRHSQIVEKLDLNCRPCSLHGPKVCPQKHFRCMKDISVDEVRRVVESLLATTA